MANLVYENEAAAITWLASGRQAVADISVVHNHGGKTDTTGGSTYTLPYNITNSNHLIWFVGSSDSVHAPGASIPTKSSGSGTFDTPIEDASDSYLSTDVYYDIRIYRIPITGTGNLVMNTNGSGQAHIYGCIEISGYDSIDGSQYINSGSSQDESTGNMTGHTGGLMIGGAFEYSTADPTYSSLTDTEIYKNSNSTYCTGQMQYRLVSGDESHAITAHIANSMAWRTLGLVYKKAASSSAALTGTATASITEADVVTGGKTIIITLTGTTWVAN